MLPSPLPLSPSLRHRPSPLLNQTHSSSSLMACACREIDIARARVAELLARAGRCAGAQVLNATVARGTA